MPIPSEKFMKYRPDIDGLRAVAVLLVVLYHAGCSYVSGGYVGVDVFFVISGYLITKIIVTRILSEDFSLKEFYLKRIRRLYPPLLIVVTFVLLFSSFYLLPVDYRNLGISAIFTLFYSANIYFWKNRSDYFSPQTEGMPLLHTWSLAIEEQYYIFYPIFLILISKFLKKKNEKSYVPFMMGIFLLSFVLSVLSVHLMPSVAFYLLPMRMWELTLGGVLALNVFKAGSNHSLNSFIASLGLIMILLPAVFFTETTLFPGYNALFPCLGTALIIYANTQENFVKKLLSLRVMVLIGLISYSLYLWHWPFLSATKYFFGLIPDSIYTLILIVDVILSFIFAYLTYRYVEVPLRSIDFSNKPLKLLMPSFLFVLAISLVSFYIFKQNGVKSRFPEKITELSSATEDYNPDEREYMNLNIRLLFSDIPWNKYPELGNTAQKNYSFAVVGDSHADMLRETFNYLAKELNIKGKLLANSGNIPFIGVYRGDYPQWFNYVEIKRDFFDFILKHKIKLVFLCGRWAWYLKSYYKFEGKGLRPVVICDNETSSCDSYSLEKNLAVFKRGLEKTVKFFQERRIKVVVLLDIPEIGWSVPEVLAKKSLLEYWGIHVQSKYLLPTIDEYYERQKEVIALFEDARRKYGITLIRTYVPLFKSSKYVKLFDENGYLLYSDDDHLSIHGALFVAKNLPELKTILESFLQKGSPIGKSF
ncbi:MAG: hypothetical protein DSY34_05330 [Desulfurobacterium sp.]|nr:MAG: hypothetical protein DSY34_05330 [Desulfurobacterium sp.]